MRQLLWAAGACAVVVLAGRSAAQGPAMPGQIVSTGYGLGPAGQQLPRAAAPVGRPINLPDDNPLLRRYDPSRPYDVFQGTNLDPRSVVAPVNGIGDQTILDRLYDKLKSVLGFARPPAVSAMNYTPGIGRRTRDRIEATTWRRD